MADLPIEPMPMPDLCASPYGCSIPPGGLPVTGDPYARSPEFPFNDNPYSSGTSYPGYVPIARPPPRPSSPPARGAPARPTTPRPPSTPPRSIAAPAAPGAIAAAVFTPFIRTNQPVKTIPDWLAQEQLRIASGDQYIAELPPPADAPLGEAPQFGLNIPDYQTYSNPEAEWVSNLLAGQVESPELSIIEGEFGVIPEAVPAELPLGALAGTLVAGAAMALSPTSTAPPALDEAIPRTGAEIGPQGGFEALTNPFMVSIPGTPYQLATVPLPQTAPPEVFTYEPGSFTATIPNVEGLPVSAFEPVSAGIQPIVVQAPAAAPHVDPDILLSQFLSNLPGVGNLPQVSGRTGPASRANTGPQVSPAFPTPYFTELGGTSTRPFTPSKTYPIAQTQTQTQPQLQLSTPTPDKTQECKKCKPTEKKPQKKKPREQCHEGTYQQLKRGIIYHPKRTVKCR